MAFNQLYLKTFWISELSMKTSLVPVQRKHWQLIYSPYITYPKECLHFLVSCPKVSPILLSIKIRLGFNKVNQTLEFQNRFVNFNEPNISRKICGKSLHSMHNFHEDFTLPLNCSAVLFIIFSLQSWNFNAFIPIWIIDIFISNITFAFWSNVNVNLWAENHYISGFNFIFNAKIKIFTCKKNFVSESVINWSVSSL